MVKIRSCNCANCILYKRHYGQKAKALAKSLPNRKFRHETKRAITSQRDVPESQSGAVWA